MIIADRILHCGIWILDFFAPVTLTLSRWPSYILGQIRIGLSRLSCQGQGHKSKKVCLYFLYAGAAASVERQPCYSSGTGWHNIEIASSLQADFMNDREKFAQKYRMTFLTNCIFRPGRFLAAPCIIIIRRWRCWSCGADSGRTWHRMLYTAASSAAASIILRLRESAAR